MWPIYASISQCDTSYRKTHSVNKFKLWRHTLAGLCDIVIFIKMVATQGKGVLSFKQS